MLGTCPDDELAARLGRPVKAVTAMRKYRKRRDQVLAGQRNRYAKAPEKKRQRSRDAYHGTAGVRERQLDLKRQQRQQNSKATSFPQGE